MSLKISLAKAKITPSTKGIAMLGYGNPKQVVRTKDTPLFARTLYIEGETKKLLLINLEICFVSDSIRSETLKKLNETDEFQNLKEEELVITAQHTHSAPGGYSHYALYNMPTPGFVQEVLDSIIEGSIQSCLAAKVALTEGSIEFVKGHFSPKLPVGFNRSLLAFVKNPEVEKENLSTSPHLAMDREMKLLRFSSPEKVLGLCNWFGVHATSLPNDNTSISSDNKGFAATKVESNFDEEFVAMFNQGNAGDISPNWIWDQELKRTRGLAKDPFENVKQNGKIQADKALELLESEENLKLNSNLDSILCYQNFSDLTVDSEFLPSGETSAQTSPACHGVAFIQGTEEGPGIHFLLGLVLKIWASGVKALNIALSFSWTEEEKKRIWNYYQSQGNKDIFIEAGKKKIMGFSDLNLLPIPGVIDPLVNRIKRVFQNGGLYGKSWTQEVLPVQFSRIGELLICFLPAETTTIAGKRIKEQLLKEFENEGISEVVISPYSNGFCGYITTPEEYEVQLYEGGHTVFGKWTLPAFQTVIKRLSAEFKKEKEDRDLSWSINPPEFTEEELAKRKFHTH